MTEDDIQFIKAVLRCDHSRAKALIGQINIVKADQSGLSVALICLWMLDQNLATIQAQLAAAFPQFSVDQIQNADDLQQLIVETVLPEVNRKTLSFLQGIATVLKQLEVAGSPEAKFFVLCAEGALGQIQNNENLQTQFREIAEQLSTKIMLKFSAPKSLTFAFPNLNSSAMPMSSLSSLPTIAEEDSEEDLDHEVVEDKPTLQRKPRFGLKSSDSK